MRVVDNVELLPKLVDCTPMAKTGHNFPEFPLVILTPSDSNNNSKGDFDWDAPTSRSNRRENIQTRDASLSSQSSNAILISKNESAHHNDGLKQELLLKGAQSNKGTMHNHFTERSQLYKDPKDYKRSRNQHEGRNLDISQTSIQSTVDLHHNAPCLFTQDVNSNQRTLIYDNSTTPSIEMVTKTTTTKLKRSKSERIQRTKVDELPRSKCDIKRTVNDKQGRSGVVFIEGGKSSETVKTNGVCRSHSVVEKRREGIDLPPISIQKKQHGLSHSITDTFPIKSVPATKDLERSVGLTESNYSINSQQSGSKYIHQNHNNNNSDVISKSNKPTGPVNSTTALVRNGPGSQGGKVLLESRHRKRLGDTKALIDKYMNPEPVVYQSDLSFLFKDKSPEEVVNTLGKSFATWNKRDRSREELNMLDFGNSYLNKKKKTYGITEAKLIYPPAERLTPMKDEQKPTAEFGGNSLQESHAHPQRLENPSEVSKTPKPSKRVLFNEDTTEIMDIHEIEPPLEFAARVGRQSFEGLSTLRDSTVSTPIDTSTHSSTPSLPPKPILKSKTYIEPEHISWADCYQDSSDDESDTFSDPGSYSYKDYLRNSGSTSRLSLPTLSSSVSIVSSAASSRQSPRFSSSSNNKLRCRNLVSPRTRIGDRSGRSHRSKSRGSNGSNSFQCSKEFALVLQNLDSSDEEGGNDTQF